MKLKFNLGSTYIIVLVGILIMSSNAQGIPKYEVDIIAEEPNENFSRRNSPGNADKIEDLPYAIRIDQPEKNRNSQELYLERREKAQESLPKNTKISERDMYKSNSNQEKTADSFEAQSAPENDKMFDSDVLQQGDSNNKVPYSEVIRSFLNNVKSNTASAQGADDNHQKFTFTEMLEPGSKLDKMPYSDVITSFLTNFKRTDKENPEFPSSNEKERQHDIYYNLFKNIHGSKSTKNPQSFDSELEAKFFKNSKRRNSEEAEPISKNQKMPYFELMDTILKNDRMPYSDIIDSVLSRMKLPESLITNAGVQMLSMPDPETYVDSFLKFLHKRIGEILWGENEANGKSTLSTFLKLILQSEEPENALEALIENGKFIGIILTLMKDIGEFNKNFLAQHSPKRGSSS